MSDQTKKQRIISLLTMQKKQISAMDENQLVSTIQEVDQIRQDSVRDGRFLGILKRCG